MDSTKFLKTVIIILLILNIGTLGFIWMHHHGHMGPPPPHDRGDVGGFLTHELMFDEAQKKQFELLKEEHNHSVEGLQEEGRELHHHFFDLLQNASPDSTAVQKAAASIAENQKQIEMITFYHFQKVRMICNPAQQKKFDEVIDEALRMMAPKPPREDGPPGR